MVVASDASGVAGAVLSLLPDVPVPVYLNVEPPSSAMPPWVIASCTTTGHEVTEAMRFTAHAGRLETRVVGLSVGSVDAWSDGLLIPALHCRVPPSPEGFTVGQLTLTDDSGAYMAGLTAVDTARRYVVRVLRFRFTWSRP